MTISFVLQEATEKVMEDLMNQQEAERTQLTAEISTMRAEQQKLEAARADLQQRVSVLTDKLNEKDEETGEHLRGSFVIDENLTVSGACFNGLL